MGEIVLCGDDAANNNLSGEVVMNGSDQGDVIDGIRILPQRQEVTGEFKLTQIDKDGEITVTVKGRSGSAEELIADFRDRLFGVASWIENAYDLPIEDDNDPVRARVVFDPS